LVGCSGRCLVPVIQGLASCWVHQGALNISSLLHFPG
jgi:hypothetical protein